MNANKNTQVNYENRLVAFVDILGFSKLIAKSETDPGIVPLMINVLNLIKSNEGIKDQFGVELDVRMEFTAFSDCFVLSSRVPEDFVNAALYQVALICSYLLGLGWFARGAIVEGRLFHKDNIVFGPGFLDAYCKERNEAIYPRIIVSNDLVERYNHEIKVAELHKVRNKWSATLLRKDKDNNCYLDTIYTIPFSLKNADEKEHIELIKVQVQKQIKDHENDQRTLMKYTWFKDYFNIIVEEHQDYNIEKLG